MKPFTQASSVWLIFAVKKPPPGSFYDPGGGLFFYIYFMIYVSYISILNISMTCSSVASLGLPG